MWTWISLGANAVTLVFAVIILRYQKTIRGQLEIIRDRQYDESQGG
jgi:hypothetical protein